MDPNRQNNTMYRPILKENAKSSMRGVQGLYLVSLVTVLITSAPNIVIRLSSMGSAILNADTVEEMLYAYQQMAEVGSSLFLVSLALDVFLSLIQAGWSLYCLRVSRDEDPGGMGTLFECFQQFWRFFTANLLMGLFTVLWSMLFVIPGIIAALSYSQTIYIMLDNPDMSAMEAIRESKQLMKGYKADYFVLGLSFLGWALLSVLTMGILQIWLLPYETITYANFYNALIGWEPAAAQPWDPADAAQNAPPPQDREWWE